MPPRLAAIAVLLAVASAVGCGSSSEESSVASPSEESSTASPSQESSSSNSEPAAPSPPPTGAPVGASAEGCETFAADAAALRATGIACEQARRVMYGWQRQPACALPAIASRGGCRVHSFRCQAARGDRGLAVSCARAGESLAFLLRRP